MSKSTGLLADRIWDRIEKTEKCWLWTGATYTNGYGYVTFGPQGKQSKLYVHRVMWIIHNDAPIPEGMSIDHVCRVRSCVNPSHLRVSTPSGQIQNQPLRGDNTSGERGVYNHRHYWQAIVQVNGKRYTRSFTKAKYGEREAFRLATAAAREMRAALMPYATD